MRGAAATAIGKIGTAEDGKALIPLLADESSAVRNRVLQALGVLRVREAGPALRELYEANRRKEGGPKVLAALSRIGDPAQADLFQELVQDPDPERKRLAIEGLGRISDVSRLPAFKKDYQREKNDELRLAYSFALTLLGDRAFLDTIVLTLPSRTLGSRSRGYLLEMGPAILPDLYPYLNDPEAEIRATLCDIIASFGDPEAIPRLTPLLNDPSPTVADRANRAVERLRRVAERGPRAEAGLRRGGGVRDGRPSVVAALGAAAFCRRRLRPSAGIGGGDSSLAGPVRDGKALLDAGQLDGALAELQKAPADPDALYYQGLVWAKKAETAPLPTPPPPPSPLPKRLAAAARPGVQARGDPGRAALREGDRGPARDARRRTSPWPSSSRPTPRTSTTSRRRRRARRSRPSPAGPPAPSDMSVDRVVRAYRVGHAGGPGGSEARWTS